ncbi:MAG: spore coat protein CotH [Ruminococcus sp.]|nr:spore coat protein CotH [Ruminococcus sp.]
MNINFKKLTASLLGLILSCSALSLNAFGENKAGSPLITTDYAQDGNLFDCDTVHTINLIISEENWNSMTAHAEDEIYAPCDAEIDGELIQNIAIRPKGNSSLSSISGQGSTHFSFKIEFDHFDDAVTYHGLDKLSLNNLGQDPSCMKDFMAYHLMNDMGVSAPLSSYTVLQLNGEDFGLYLAVEAVEDSFCFRNYGEDAGQLYKPDSFGMDSLDMSGMLKYEEGSSMWVTEQIMNGNYYADTSKGDRADILGAMLNAVFTPEQTAVASLQYVGDNLEDYSDLWNTAVFKPKAEDRERLMNSIKTLNQGENSLSVLDTDSLLRYFAVHNFVNNYDGYTSMFVHNFYLHEKDGILSLIPWDYNLAFGSFNYESAVSSVIDRDFFDCVPDKGNAMSTEQSLINYPIDTPLYSVEMKNRPLVNALFSNQETLQQYHEILDEMLKNCFENGSYEKLYQQAYEQIRPYVEKNLTFYTSEQFENGAQAIQYYLTYRAESIRGQLAGEIPSTAEGQKANPETLIQPEGLNLADLADFGALVPFLNENLLSQVLSIFLENNFAYNAAGAVEAVHYYADHPAKLMKKIPVLMQIPEIRSAVMQKTAPYLVIFILVTFLIIFICVLIKKCRRNKKTIS